MATQEKTQQAFAHRIMTVLLADLQDRAGLADVWFSMDREEQCEMQSEWEAEVLAHLKVYDKGTKS